MVDADHSGDTDGLVLAKGALQIVGIPEGLALRLARDHRALAAPALGLPPIPRAQVAAVPIRKRSIELGSFVVDRVASTKAAVDELELRVRGDGTFSYTARFQDIRGSHVSWSAEDSSAR